MLEYSIDFIFKDEDIDARGYLSPSHILRLFQQVAGGHADSAGIGFDDLLKQGLIWVVTRIRYTVQGCFEPSKQYTLYTYPMPKQSLLYVRDYYIKDEDGNIIIKGSSQWCILNFITRKIERTDFDFEGEFSNVKAFDDGFPRVKNIEGDIIAKHTVVPDDIDNNQHTNNCKYAEFIYDYIKDYNYSDFSITFQKETVLGDMIVFEKDVQNCDSVVISGKLADSGDNVFTAKIWH